MFKDAIELVFCCKIWTLQKMHAHFFEQLLFLSNKNWKVHFLFSIARQMQRQSDKMRNYLQSCVCRLIQCCQKFQTKISQIFTYSSDQK